MTTEKEISFDQECGSCGGTGLYVGMAERDGAAVVCRTCDGKGHYTFTHKYRSFTNLKKRGGVERVFAAACGICIGTGKGRFTLEDFGGMPYEDWLNGRPFPPQSEMRAFVCPGWWFQSVDYKRKPKWAECAVGGAFSGCAGFAAKEKCWERWDAEERAREKEATHGE